MKEQIEYSTDVPCTWCPGCGNFSIAKALRAALAEEELLPQNMVIVSGIGQAAKLPHYVRCNGFNGLHGRAVAAATAIKLAVQEMPVIVHCGDGDCYGEGLNHLIHAIRRNIDLCVIVHDNRIYGLTKGQSSPTTAWGQRTSSEPQGASNHPLNPLTLALSQDCSFLAQAFSGKEEQLSDLIQKGIRHKGFSLINVLQPCVSFNKLHTFKWFKERTYELPPDWDEKNREAAMTKLLQNDDTLPLGLLYRRERKAFVDELSEAQRIPMRQREPRPEQVKTLFDGLR